MTKGQINKEFLDVSMDHNRRYITYYALLDVFSRCMLAVDKQNIQYQCLQDAQDDETWCNTSFGIIFA